MKRLSALLLFIALPALLLSACGGGGSSTQGGSTQGGSSGQTETGPSNAAQGTRSQSAGSSGGKSGGGGKGSNGGGQSHYRGGEKSIEEFGNEAEGSSRAAVLGVFTGYLNALAAKDDATACNYLAASVQRSLEQFVTPALRRKGCAAILPKLLSPTAAAIARQQAAGRIAKVRVEGERAFVVFHAPGAKLYMLTMTREGGEWKVALVAASVLVPSAATLGQ
jgi:hypothetical protein